MENIIKKKKRAFIKGLSKVLLAIISSGVVLTPIQAVAHNAYFLGITVDTSKFRYEGTVGFDDNDLVANNHKEAQIADFSSFEIKADGFKLPTPTLNMDGDKNKDKYKDTSGVRGGNGDHGMIYTFPAIHDRTSPWDGGSQDMDRAYWVSENLIGGFNEAMTFVMARSGFDKSSSNALSDFMKLAVKVADTGGSAIRNGSATLTENGKTIKFTKGAKSVANGLISDYYLTLSVDGESVETIYKVPKGYMPGQELYPTVPEKMRDELRGLGKFDEDDADIAFLNWRHVVLQAHYNYEVKNVSYSSVTEIIKPGKLEQMVSELLASLVGKLRDMLGLFSLQELMLNQGTRDGGYLYGIMPKQWFKSSQLLHWVCQVIAWSLLIGALVKLLVQRNIASINTSMRVNLMEGIQNILLTGFMLSLIIPIFHALGSINDKLVNVFGQSSMWIQAFGDTTTGSSGLLAVVVMNIVYFTIMLYFNFVYIMRAITVSLLYATAPLFVVSIAFGGKFKQLFGNWMKELISNIFMQSFHAISLSFFASANYAGVRGIEGVVLLYAFVPMTQFFRQSLMGLSGGTAEKLGGQALGAGISMVSGAIGGATMGSKVSGASANKTATTKQTSSTGGIQTKSSEALRQKSNPSANSQEGIGKVNGFGDASDRIPNAELTNFGKGVEKFNDWKQNSKSGKVASGVGSALVTGAKVGGKVVKTAGSVGGKALSVGAGAGMVIAGSSIGNQQLAGLGGRNLMKGTSGLVSSAKGTMSSAKEGMSNLAQKTTDKLMYKSPSDNEGLMYANDKGDGTIDYKHDSEGLRMGAGISQINDNGKSLQYELDAMYDEKSGNVKFETDSLNKGESYENLNSMVSSFANSDEEAMAYYQKQGIQHVGLNENTGKVVITKSKMNSGTNSVSKSGDSVVINKDNTANFSNKDVYNIPKYVPRASQKDYSKSHKTI